MQALLEVNGSRNWTYLNQQLQPDEDSVKYATINTHHDLYQVNRLPFGIASAPAIYQQLMDTILQDIPHVICYIDDILVTGSNNTEHLQNLTTVFQRLEKHGLRMKKFKCVFLQMSCHLSRSQNRCRRPSAVPSKLKLMPLLMP